MHLASNKCEQLVNEWYRFQNMRAFVVPDLTIDSVRAGSP